MMRLADTSPPILSSFQWMTGTVLTTHGQISNCVKEIVEVGTSKELHFSFQWNQQQGKPLPYRGRQVQEEIEVVFWGNGE